MNNAVFDKVLLLALVVGVCMPALAGKTDRRLLTRLKKVKDLPVDAKTLASLDDEDTIGDSKYKFSLQRGEISSWKAKEEGKTPFRLFVSVYSYKDNRGRIYLDGDGEILLINEKDELTQSVKLKLRALCPT